jgi:diguanylate cyclase (GGDEF)-like protein/PAS domain S-box-containing protein
VPPLKSEQIQTFIEGIRASVAVLERDENDRIIVASCNGLFTGMVGGGNSLTRSAPFLLDDLLPRYVRRPFQKKVLECMGAAAPLEFEQAYDLKNGTRWWRLSLNPVVEHDVVVRILVTGLDITTKVELRHELTISNSRFSSVIDAAYDSIVTIDQRMRIRLFNQAAADLFGYEPEEVLGESINVLLPEGARANHDRYVDQFARSPVRSRQMDERSRVHGRHKDGTLFPVEIAISKMNVDGMVEFTAVIRDITDRVRLLELLERQAATDPLTGLANRREFFEVARSQFAAAQKDGTAVSIQMIDVDHFKLVNDTHGHDGGDEVLRLLARVGQQTVRHLDVFARYGGEEFIVLMPETDHAQAVAMAERIRLIFDRQSFVHTWSREPVPFTISTGVATLRASDEDIESIIKRADEALYRAKDGGRNRVQSDEDDQS